MVMMMLMFKFRNFCNQKNTLECARLCMEKGNECKGIQYQKKNSGNGVCTLYNKLGQTKTSKFFVVYEKEVMCNESTSEPLPEPEVGKPCPEDVQEYFEVRWRDAGALWFCCMYLVAFRWMNWWKLARCGFMQMYQQKRMVTKNQKTLKKTKENSPEDCALKCLSSVTQCVAFEYFPIKVISWRLCILTNMVWFNSHCVYLCLRIFLSLSTLFFSYFSSAWCWSKKTFTLYNVVVFLFFDFPTEHVCTQA